MLGSPLEDIADCIRSCCITEGGLDKKSAEILVEGYIQNTDKETAQNLKNNLPAVFLI